jgi:phosphopantetheinyl transferase
MVDFRDLIPTPAPSLILPGVPPSKSIQLYCFDLPENFPPELTQAFQETLSPAELKLSLPRQFIALKLREALSESLEINSQLIEFKTKNKGKPIISPEQNSLNLSFNLSHSKHRVLIAISPHEVGVDIEKKRPANILKISKRFFHSQEHQELLETKLSPEKLEKKFFTLWTEKEALIKCEGESLAGFLKSSTKDYAEAHKIQIHSWQEEDFFYAVALKK